MRCSILLLVSFAICVSAQRNDAQPASQEEINRALEVLHKTPAVASPPVAKPSVPLKITSTSTNSAPAMTPARTQPAPNATSPLTQDMERRAREVLSDTKTDARPQPTPNPGRDALERANANEQLRKQAIAETRRGLPAAESSAQPATLADEEQRKAQQELDRQKNLERIEMEVQRARIARQQKTVEAAAAQTNAPAPGIVASQANAPAPTVSERQANAPADAVAKAPTNAPAPKVVAAPAPAPPPVKPAPVIPAQPVTAPPAPRPQVVQQAPAPAPAVAATPTPQSSAQTNVAFKGLAPDMEQRARSILDQVMSNTKGASLPVLATQPPKAAPLIPAPQPQPQTLPNTNSVIRGPEVTPAPVASAPAKTVSPEQEAKAREMLNQLLARPVPAPAPAQQPSSVQKPAPAPTPAPVVAEKQAAPAPAPAPVVPQPAPAPKTVTQAPAPAPKVEVAAPMAPDQEAKARELLNKVLSSSPAPAPAPTPVASKPVESSKTTPAPMPTPAPAVENKAAPPVDKRAQEDARRQAKLKAEIEDQTRREIARMEEESQARAKEMAKRRMEEEKRAQNHKAPVKTEVTPVAAAKPAPIPATTPVRNTTPEPKPTEKPKSSEKPKGGKENGAVKANAPVQETWKDSSKSREQRLSELLDAYRTDQISAEKYHSERAKILGSSQ